MIIHYLCTTLLFVFINMQIIVLFDIAKALCIVLVVVGHYFPENSPVWYECLNKLIYSFHMPLFMAGAITMGRGVASSVVEMRSSAMPCAASAPPGPSAPTGSAASTRMCRKEGGKRMYGAILGDIVGSPYEFDCNNYKAKNFPLFSRRSDFTDDTVMTLAVAKALLSSRGQDDAAIKAALVREMQQLGRAYPDRGYGTHFGGWLYEDDPQPYRSYGNGSAMRVSSAAWLAKDMAETLRLARLTAEVTHDHPEGIKGAQATAAAIFLARTGHDKAEIKAYVEREFGYDLSRSCDEIRPTYHHVESCQETVPQAIIAFLESTSFEDALRTAVSLGGDSDTLAAITGSIAEAFYGVPENLKQECRKRLTPELEEILQACENMILQR